ncbi:MAG TPA: relaxase/mobilization nuclease, partial [Cyanobacteria bacterium UBA12227]|nr:relaxase/mobilization nuclease [Cyanobacteria bacterium UBA12227]
MIGKTVKGNGFGGVLRYIFDKPEAEYIGGNMTATTKRGLAREFRAVASVNVPRRL